MNREHLYWKGKMIEELNREELIEAVYAFADRAQFYKSDSEFYLHKARNFLNNEGCK